MAKKKYTQINIWAETSERIRKQVRNRRRIKGNEYLTLAEYVDQLSKLK